MSEDRQIEKLYEEINTLRTEAAAAYNKAINVSVHELPSDPMSEWNMLADKVLLKIKELEEILCDTGKDNRKYVIG